MFKRSIRRFYHNWNTVKVEGKEKYFLYDENNVMKSYWHDIPIKDTGYSENEFNFAVEIPQNRLAKLEVDKWIPGNPITQDLRTHPITKAKVDRFYYIFPSFNYGIIPQTYEMPKPMSEFDNLSVFFFN